MSFENTVGKDMYLQYMSFENTVGKGEIARCENTVGKDMYLQYMSFENTVGKGEIARYGQFLLFLQYFQKTCTADT